VSSSKPDKAVLERNIEGPVVAYAIKGGCLVLKLNTMGRRSWPDRMFLFDGKVLFIEFKKPGGKPTPDQAVVHKKLKAAGFDCFVIDNVALGKGGGGGAVGERPCEHRRPEQTEQAGQGAARQAEAHVGPDAQGRVQKGEDLMYDRNKEEFVEVSEEKADSVRTNGGIVFCVGEVVDVDGYKFKVRKITKKDIVLRPI
jgi:hypothetical protein